MRYSKGNLSYLEEIFSEFGYMVRYEKGNFKSDYCILNSKNLIIVNKYFATDGRMNCLMDILQDLSPELDKSILKDAKHKEIYKKVVGK